MATAILCNNWSDLDTMQIPEELKSYFKQKAGSEVSSISYQGSFGILYAECISGESNSTNLEKWRKAGNKITGSCNQLKEIALDIQNAGISAAQALAFAEGAVLGNYKFDKYVKDKTSKANTLKDFNLSGDGSDGLKDLKLLCEAVYKTRDLVNEPVNQLNAEQLSEKFTAMGKESGFSVEVWNKSKIESQKMGGILAVNAGSQQPPTFNIMEYKPAHAKNEKPIVLVGKGVVFDTGGLSLKPTPQSMDQMKCDMAGSAAVAGIMYAVAKSALPLWMIALVPATDNRPGENATCPGDIITMYDGTTVEVLNTDAEGRLVLADALAFAKKYEPELVMDFATLTGAAMRALGAYGSALMGNADEAIKNEIKEAGDKVYERLAELPLWEEYFEDTKGEISDLKNLGKSEGGAQSAAMFLRYFTDYPWLHFDIAGTAFLTGNDAYRPKGGTGVGVRLIFEFLKQRANGQ
ncbi:MAG: leucyl aminopeptidase family protein [Bacteroidetes bacterium]|nr:leucyl aminopeptidase family protein [Bacteroidota bacterium]